MDFNDLNNEVVSLKNQLAKLENQLARTARMESGSGGGGGWTAVDASTGTKGIGKTSVAPASPTNPIFVEDSDPRNTNSRPPNGAASGVLTGSYPGPSGLAASGVSAGSYVNAGFTVGADGRLTAAASGMTSGLWAARPGSPVDGQKYFATDRGLTGTEYTWKTGLPVAGGGTTSKWLGPLQLVTIPYLPSSTSNQFTALANNVWFDIHPDNTSDVYVELITTVWRVVTTNNATNYWSWTVRFRDAAAATSTTATVDTKLFSLATQTPITVLSSLLITRANFYDVYFDIGKVLSPGTLSTSPVKMYYRLVGA